MGFPFAGPRDRGTPSAPEVSAPQESAAEEDPLDPLLIPLGWPVLRGENRLLLLHGLHCFFCLVAGRAAPI
jgi:hypothetical protein